MHALVPPCHITLNIAHGLERNYNVGSMLGLGIPNHCTRASQHVLLFGGGRGDKRAALHIVLCYLRETNRLGVAQLQVNDIDWLAVSATAHIVKTMPSKSCRQEQQHLQHPPLCTTYC